MLREGSHRETSCLEAIVLKSLADSKTFSLSSSDARGWLARPADGAFSLSMLEVSSPKQARQSPKENPVVRD